MREASTLDKDRKAAGRLTAVLENCESVAALPHFVEVWLRKRGSTLL